MDVISLLMWVLALALAWKAYCRPKKLHRQGAKAALDSMLATFPIIFMAILVSGFFSVIVPTELVAHWLGSGSGARGIMVGSLLGGFTPGGPIICLPIVAIFYKAGAGLGPLVAYLTAWSVFAFHRLFAYEIPMIGLRFALIRVLASIALPPLAGMLAALWERFI